MSEEKQQWAVYLDYGLTPELEGEVRWGGRMLVHTVVLGGSISRHRRGASEWLAYVMGYQEFDQETLWEVDEDDLPYGYTFQTYYVAPYCGADIEKGVTA